MSNTARFEQPDNRLDVTGVPYGPITPEAAEAYQVIGPDIIADLHPRSRNGVLPIEYWESYRRAEGVGLAQAVVAQLASDSAAMERAGGFDGIHWVGAAPDAGDHSLATPATDPVSLATRLASLFDPYVVEHLMTTYFAAAQSPAFQQFCRTLLEAVPATPDDEGAGRRLLVVDLPTDDYPTEDLILRTLFALRPPHKAITIGQFNEDAPSPYELNQLLPRERKA